MTIKQFIEKAIEGGWKSEVLWGTAKQYVSDRNLPTMFLDPEAWKAVAKVEGWNVGWYGKNVPSWHYAMLKLIDALAEGKTIEQYLETL